VVPEATVEAFRTVILAVVALVAGALLSMIGTTGRVLVMLKLAIQVPQLGRERSEVAIEYSLAAQYDVPFVGSTVMPLKSPIRVPW
jgi:hypothetical protein